jgi:hypothetical protein
MMPNPFSRALLDQAGTPVSMLPCTVTQVTPLLITVLGATDVPAVKVAGASYSLGAANALFVSGASPIVLPIG